MYKTKLVSAAASPTKTPIVVQRSTKSVTISEDPSVANYPTTALSIQAPSNTDDSVQILAGTSFTFVNPGSFWHAGEILGYVTPVTGSTTLRQIESGI